MTNAGGASGRGEDYLVTARKWRPKSFSEVYAQNHVITTLQNAILQGRVAHAYLFSGPRGVGKTTTARLLARAVNCPLEITQPGTLPDPLGECERCREIQDGRSFDIIEIDGASNRGVDEIRNLREAVRVPPQQARYKVYIIDEVHMLTKEAFNALLKTLEEPPSHVIFVFATTEVHKVPPTILSRCQRFDFRRIPAEEIMQSLRHIAREEHIELDEESLRTIAQRGDGSLRDAQGVFDQVVALCGNSITNRAILEALNIVDRDLYFSVTGLVKSRDTRGVLALVEEILKRGYDIREFLSGLLEHLRNILVTATSGGTEGLDLSEGSRKRYAEEAALFTVPDLLRMMRLVGATEAAIRWVPQPRYRLEADLLQLVLMPESIDIRRLVDEIQELKKKPLSPPPTA